MPVGAAADAQRQAVAVLSSDAARSMLEPVEFEGMSEPSKCCVMWQHIEWADLVLQGLKVIELRNRPPVHPEHNGERSLIGRRIGIAISGAGCRDHGWMVVGHATIAAAWRVADNEDAWAWVAKRACLAPTSPRMYRKRGQQLWAWLLSDVAAYASPLRFHSSMGQGLPFRVMGDAEEEKWWPAYWKQDELECKHCSLRGIPPRP